MSLSMYLYIPKQKRTAPPAVSGGDIELDNAFKKALRAGKVKK